MAVETVTVRLDETWKALSLDNAAAMKWEVVGYRDAIFAIGDSAPAAGSFDGMRDRSIPPTVWGTAKVYARAVRDFALVSVTRTVNAGNASTPVLQKLALSAASFVSNAASGSVIGNVQNKAAGSTLRVISGGKRVAVNSDGSSALVGLEPGAPGKFFATIRESHPDAGENDTTLEFTVTPPALTITGSPPGATEGQDYTWRPIVAGGYGERSFRLAGSLPTGWSMSSTTGAIYAPAAFVRGSIGSISGLSIAVTDEAGQTATLANISISVTGGASPGGEADAFSFVSQSNLEALGTSATYAGQIMPAGYTGPDPRIQIWNRSAHAFETYEPYVNSKGENASATWGPEYAFAKAWIAANPGKTCYILKRAQGSTGLAPDAGAQDWAKSSNELYAGMTTIVNEATAALAAQGLTLKNRMCFSRIGEEDSKDSAKAAAYVSNFQAFIASSRVDWGYTRHCVSRLHIEQTQSGFAFWSTVRDGMKAVADADANVEIVNTDGPVFVDQTLHLGPTSIDKMGRDFYWVFSKGWTQFPYAGLTQIAEVARGRFAYPAVQGDITTMKSGTIENVLGITTTATSTRTYVDSLGVRKNNLAADTLRQTWEGGRQQFVVEGTNLNRVQSPRDLTNAAWTATNATVAKNQIGQDGAANSASSITATAANATVLQAITDATSRARVGQAVLKRLVGTGAIRMTLDGTTFTDVTTTAGWARVAIPTQTLANPTIGFQLATSGDSIAVDYVTTDDNAFYTSPIPAASTRNPENVTFKENAALQGATGTLAIKSSGSRNTTGVFFSGDTGKILGRTANAAQAAGTLFSGAGATATVGTGSVTGDFGAAITYDGAETRVAVNGGAVAVGAETIAAHTTGIKIGMVGTNASSQIAGSIDALYAGPTKISDAQLQALAVAHLAA